MRQEGQSRGESAAGKMLAVVRHSVSKRDYNGVEVLSEVGQGHCSKAA